MFTRLGERGVTVVTGVDSGIAPTKRHGNAWRTVGELIKGGYPAEEALAAATSVAAAAVRAHGADRPAREGVRRRRTRRG